jgi:hypothetical protein
LDSIQKDTQFQYDYLICKLFSLDVLKKFYSRNLQNAEREQELNVEVHDGLESQKNLNKNQEIEFKDQEMPEKKLEI